MHSPGVAQAGMARHIYDVESVRDDGQYQTIFLDGLLRAWVVDAGVNRTTRQDGVARGRAYYHQSRAGPRRHQGSAINHSLVDQVEIRFLDGEASRSGVDAEG